MYLYKKKILFFCNVVLWKAQLNGLLNLIHKEIKNKNKIYLLFCDSTLESCPPNNQKIKSICILCKNYQKNIYKKYLNKDVKLIKLNLETEKYNKKFCFKNFDDFKDFKFDGAPLGTLVTSDLTTLFKDSNLNFEQVSDLAQKKLSSSISLYKKSLEVIKENKIDVVYAWNGRRGSDGSVLYAAKKLKKNYYSYISSPKGTHLIVRKSLNVHDLKLNKSEIKKINIKNFFKNSTEVKKYIKKQFFYLSKGVSSSFKIFHNIKKKNYTSLNFKKKKNVITIFTSTLWEHSSLGKDWDIVFDNKKINFLNLLDQIVNNEKILKFNDIIIKWHPYHMYSSKNELNEIENFIKKNNHIKNYRYYENVSIYSLIHISDNVITIGSTTGVEYSYIKLKKVILIGPSYYEDLNFVERCKNMKQLVTSINGDLKLKKIDYDNFAKFIFWNALPSAAFKIKNYKYSISIKIYLYIISIIQKICEKTSKS
jgi:hypothetical protein